MKLKVITILFFLSCMYSQVSVAQEPYQNFRFFKDNYISLEGVRNQPTAASQKQFASGRTSAFVGFRHILRDRWLMGVHSGFKSLKLRETGENISIFSILQESQMLYRLNHPVYFAIGPRLLYLLPTIGNKIPPKREKRFNREIGLAISGSIHFAINEYMILSFRIEQWRGVNREIFQGTESAIGINFALP